MKHRPLIPTLNVAAMAVIILVLNAMPVAAQDEWDAPDRIVAIGDVHGDYDQFATLLRQAGLIDARNRWAGGGTHLVQLGDVVDRGPDSRKAQDLLRDLDRQARRAGGRVHPLIGNHEALNIAGDLRYVHPGEYAAFKSRRAERLRDGYYDRYVAAVKARTPKEEWPLFDQAYRAAWNERFPLGYVEHRQAWAPDGDYGEWIRRNNAVIRIGRTLFLHGGIGPKFADTSIRDLNEKIRAELAQGTQVASDALIFDQDGPLWYRGFAFNTKGDAAVAEEAHLEALLARHGVDRIVVAHTPLAGAVLPLFGARVIIADVGLAAYYGSRQAYLEIEGGRLTAVHRGRRLEIPNDPAGIDAYLERAAGFDPGPSPVAAYLARRDAKPDPDENGEP